MIPSSWTEETKGVLHLYLLRMHSPLPMDTPTATVHPQKKP